MSGFNNNQLPIKNTFIHFSGSGDADAKSPRSPTEQARKHPKGSLTLSPAVLHWALLTPARSDVSDDVVMGGPGGEGAGRAPDWEATSPWRSRARTDFCLHEMPTPDAPMTASLTTPTKGAPWAATPMDCTAPGCPSSSGLRPQAPAFNMKLMSPVPCTPTRSPSKALPDFTPEAVPQFPSWQFAGGSAPAAVAAAGGPPSCGVGLPTPGRVPPPGAWPPMFRPAGWPPSGHSGQHMHTMPGPPLVPSSTTPPIGAQPSVGQPTQKVTLRLGLEPEMQGPPPPRKMPSHPEWVPVSIRGTGNFDAYMFWFTLRRADNVELGLKVQPLENNRGLQVKDVMSGGAISAWNKMWEAVGDEKSWKAIVGGDQIVQINKCCTCNTMLEEIRQNQLLKICVLREGPLPGPHNWPAPPAASMWSPCDMGPGAMAGPTPFAGNPCLGGPCGMDFAGLGACPGTLPFGSEDPGFQYWLFPSTAGR